MSNAIETSPHVDTVGAIYEAFGRGDVPFILDHLRDDVAWDEGIRPTEVPWLQPGVGKSAAVRFFEALGAGLTFDVFEPQAICAGGTTVVSVVREQARSLTTGKVTRADLVVHQWTFDDAGLVASFRHIGDWAEHEALLA
jgi:ketosteroid isomerase-like protein